MELFYKNDKERKDIEFKVLRKSWVTRRMNVSKNVTGKEIKAYIQGFYAASNPKHNKHYDKEQQFKCINIRDLDKSDDS